MKKALILITSLIAVGLLSTYAFSWGTGKGMGGYGGGANCPGIDRNAYTDLTDAQKDELAALRQKFIDDTYELRASMMQKHNEIRLLMETSQPDRTKLSRLNTELSDLMKQLQEDRIDFMLAAKKVAPELRFGRNMGQGFRSGNDRGNCPRGFSGKGYDQNQRRRHGGGGQGMNWN